MKVYYDNENRHEKRRAKMCLIDTIIKLALAWMIVVTIGIGMKSQANGFDKHFVTAIIIMFSTFFGTLIYLNYNTYRKNK
jgi:membrane protein YdbS with pleckstrin-like domain